MSVRIPSVDFWTRKEFLEARKAQMASEQNMRPPGWEDAELIIVDAGDDVICDGCGAEIPDNAELINLVEFGKRVQCDGCYQRWYASQPVKYRRLNLDGSLGPYIEGDE